MILVGILANVGILLIAALVPLLLTIRRFSDERAHAFKVVQGIVFGVVAVAVAQIPVDFPDGTVVDVCSAPLILAGVLGGPVSAVVAAGVMFAGKVYLNDAAFPALLVNLTAFAAVGSVAYGGMRWRLNRDPRLGDLPWMIVVVVLAEAAKIAVGRPFGTAEPVTAQDFWWPVLAECVGATILGGAYLTVERIRHRALDVEHAFAQSRVALQSSGAGLWYFDPVKNAIQLDDLSAAIVGRPQAGLRLTLSEFAAMLVPEDRGRVVETLGEAFADGRRFTIRGRIETAVGETVFLEISAQPTDVIDHRSAVVGTIRDVTAEEAQLTRIRLNNLALDKAANGVVICRADADMPIVYVNDAFTAITGYAAGEVLGRNCRFLHERDPEQEALLQMREALKRGEPCIAELRNYRKDGSPFWNRIKMAPIRDARGTLTHYVGIQLDITRQREVEAAAERHKERLESILSSAPDAIVTVDGDMIINEFNTAAERLFGWSRADIIGRPLNVLVPTMHAPRHDDLARRFMETAGHGARVMADWRNIQGMRADGTTFPVLVTLSRFLVDGKPAVTAIARDMTSVAEMNRELFDMSSQLSRQLQEVQAANDAKTRFLASMSHELRTPLNAIIGFSEAMRESYFGPIGNEKYAEYVDDINVSALHLLSLINDLLDLTAIENGRLSLHLEPLAIGDVIDAATVAVTTLLNAKSLTLGIEDKTDGWTVAADRRALHQCLLNLLSNAIKFTGDGGSIDIRATVDDDEMMTVSVRDDGIGIPQDRLARLGVPFEQVGDPMRAETKGTGLGLAITKRLVEGMSGSLLIESELGKGTTVSLRFPAVAGERYADVTVLDTVGEAIS